MKQHIFRLALLSAGSLETASQTRLQRLPPDFQFLSCLLVSGRVPSLRLSASELDHLTIQGHFVFNRFYLVRFHRTEGHSVGFAYFRLKHVYHFHKHLGASNR